MPTANPKARSVLIQWFIVNSVRIMKKKKLAIEMQSRAGFCGFLSFFHLKSALANAFKRVVENQEIFSYFNRLS
jgi:hypothetical protein